MCYCVLSQKPSLETFYFHSESFTMKVKSQPSACCFFLKNLNTDITYYYTLSNLPLLAVFRFLPVH